MDFDIFELLEEGLSQESGGGKERLPFTKFGEGNTHLTVLAAVKPRWTHYDPTSKLTLNCLGKNECPICAIIAASKANDTECKYKSTLKYGMIVYNHNSGQVEILDQKKTFITDFKNMLGELKEDGEAYDPTKFVTRVRRDGMGFNDTKYTFKVAPASAQAEVPAKAYETLKAQDLNDLFLNLNADQIRQVLSGKTLKEIFNPDAAEEADTADIPFDVDFTKEA